MVKNPPANAGEVRDAGLIPGSGKSPEGGNGNSLQYSCLGNPVDRGAWRATVHGVLKSRTWLSNWAHASLTSQVIRREIHFLPSTKSINLAVLVFVFLSSSSHGRSLPFPIESQLLTLCNEGKLEMYIFTKASGEVYPKNKGVVKLSSIFIALVIPLWFALPVLPVYEWVKLLPLYPIPKQSCTLIWDPRDFSALFFFILNLSSF